MNERTDFGWFLYGSDNPSPDLTNVSFSNGIFSATTGTNPNLFLLETGNPYAARLGKTGSNHPIDANTYQLLAIRMNSSTDLRRRGFSGIVTICGTARRPSAATFSI